MLNNIKANSFIKRNIHNFETLAFVIPAFLLVLNATVIPFIMNFFYSLTAWNGVSNAKVFVGLGNYLKLFAEKDFWRHLGFTFQYLAIFVVLVNVLSLVLALLLYRNRMLNNFIRASVFFPYLVSLITVGLIWEFIFGLGFETLSKLTGIRLFARGWLSEPDLVLCSVLITTMWQNIGFYMIIYIAGMVSISSSVVEAATIDGAGPFKALVHVKLPLLIPSITVCLFQSLSYALKLFEVVLVMTRGGPGDFSTTIVFDIYYEAFVNGRYGYGIAKSVIFFIIVLIITMTQLTVTKRLEVES